VCKLLYKSVTPSGIRMPLDTRLPIHLGVANFSWQLTPWQIALVFGLKGRFWQPRPKAWEIGVIPMFGLKGRFGQSSARGANGPCRADDCRRLFSQAFGQG
jgi:hypothetical protein